MKDGLEDGDEEDTTARTDEGEQEKEWPKWKHD